MKKILFSLFLLSASLLMQGQEAVINNELSLKSAEIAKTVELDDEQMAQLKAIDVQYCMAMDTALNHTDNLMEVSKKIYEANRTFDSGVYQVLTENQKVGYIKLISVYEVLAKAVFKVDFLRGTEKYSEAELQVFIGEIYTYLLTEQVALVRDRYNVSRQEENIQQLRNSEPQSLREANALQAAQHRGVQYQNGYVW